MLGFAISIHNVTKQFIHALGYALFSKNSYSFFLSSPKFPQAAELDDAQLSITGNQLLITSHK